MVVCGVGSGATAGRSGQAGSDCGGWTAGHSSSVVDGCIGDDALIDEVQEIVMPMSCR